MNEEPAVSPPARLRTIVLDCPDPLALADFYRSLLGGEVRWDGDDPDWVDLGTEAGHRLAFQQANDYAPPTWPAPERPQQVHLDLTVDDIESAEPAVLALGARRHEIQPGEAEGDRFRVYLDPAGHPFCLCWDEAQAALPSWRGHAPGVAEDRGAPGSPHRSPTIEP